MKAFLVALLLVAGLLYGAISLADRYLLPDGVTGLGALSDATE